MFNIVYSEFLKIKKSYLFIITLIASIFIPVIQCIQSLSNNYDGVSEALRYTLMKGYRVNIEVVSFQFLYTVFLSLIAGYIYSREFTDKTANIIYTYPISRTKIFIGKLITLYIIIIFIYIIQFLAVYLTVYIAWNQLPPKNIIITDLKVNIYSALVQFLIMPIPILIGSISKNIIFPVVYGILGAVSSSFMMFTGIYMQCSPFMLPALPIYYFHIGDPIDFILTITNAVLTFTISMFLCIYYYNKLDIN